jgi:hypothetical protein
MMKHPKIYTPKQGRFHIDIEEVLMVATNQKIQQMNQLKFGVFVRETENWKDLTSEGYLSRLKESRFLPAIDKIKCWDSYFSISYVKWRAELKRIAQATWQESQLKPISNLEDSWDWLVVTDDDDWLHPQLIDYISPLTEGVDFIYWDAWRYDFVLGKEDFSPHVIKNTIPSNGCAIKRNCPDLVKKSILTSSNITKPIREHLPLAKKQNNKLSMWLRHPGCYWRLLNFDFPYNFQFNTNLKTIEGFEKPIEETRTLMKALQPTWTKVL